jgi:hypothetical protein
MKHNGVSDAKSKEIRDHMSQGTLEIICFDKHTKELIGGESYTSKR